ncbi:MAG TPA: MFS transporter [Micromonosporaceae bacterium]|nr:MFS transporter [Micromonosporaceae bacterium]
MTTTVDGPVRTPDDELPASDMRLAAGDMRRASGGHDPHHARRWLILAVLGIAQLMVVLDATIVNIALPTAQHALSFSDNDRQWIITAYALAFGSLLLLGGRVADIFGRKRAFLVGLIGFAIASAVGGAATSFAMLATARALQGAFGALLAPAALSLLATTFTNPNERNKAFGIYGAIAGGGGAIGLLLGGLLTEYASWRWCLYVNLIFALAAGVGGAILLVHQKVTHRVKLDVPGAIAAAVSMFALVYGFTNAPTHGWSSVLTWGFLALGGVALAMFVWLQTRVEHPLLPLRVVLDRDRGGSYLAMFISGAGMFGVFLFLTYYMQQTLGFSPVLTGLAFLPMIGVLATTASIATTVIVPRIGAKWPLALGMGLAAIAMAMLAQLGLTSTYAAHVLPALLVMGFGLGLVFAPAMNNATAGVAPDDAGVASATVNTMQQVGGSIGTALLSTLAASAATSYLHSHAPSQLAVAQATMASYTTAFWWSAGIFLLGAILCGALLRRGRPVIDPAVAPAMAH